MPASPIRTKLEKALEAAAAPAARHVFTALMETSARAEAEAADARRAAGVSLGPLDGAIISIKDLFDVAGMVTTAASKILKEAPPAVADAPAVARLRRAGAVLVGRANMSEFAFSGIGLNPHWGNPGNARDQARAPGGSTSGGAVSVGLGIADLTLGTDTGGSTRVPAAFNGIVGFKPTSPRIPREGAFPLSYSFDSIGPLGRDVASCAAMDAILAGDEAAPLVPLAVAGMRIGVARGLLFEETENAVSEAFEAGLSTLSKAGARIVDINLDDIIRDLRGALAGAPIVACEASEIHDAWLEPRAGDYDRRVRARILMGRETPAHAYVRAMRRRETIRAAYSARIAPFDAIALPTCPIVAPLIAPLEADDALFMKTNLLALRNTSVGNFLDSPSISLPLPAPGLPVGLMLMAPSGADRRLFALAASVEAALRG